MTKLSVDSSIKKVRTSWSNSLISTVNKFFFLNELKYNHIDITEMGSLQRESLYYALDHSGIDIVAIKNDNSIPTRHTFSIKNGKSEYVKQKKNYFAIRYASIHNNPVQYDKTKQSIKEGGLFPDFLLQFFISNASLEINEKNNIIQDAALIRTTQLFEFIDPLLKRDSLQVEYCLKNRGHHFAKEYCIKFNDDGHVLEVYWDALKTNPSLKKWKRKPPYLSLDKWTEECKLPGELIEYK